jgi:hypothetical protein
MGNRRGEQTVTRLARPKGKVRYSSSTAIATASPPPMHSESMPILALR